MSSASWELGWLCVILLVGSVQAADVPFVFDNNSSSIANYTSSQIENISKQAPEIVGVPPIRASLSNDTMKNISGINKTNYQLEPIYSTYIGAPDKSIGQDWFKSGNKYYDEKNYDKAIECYEQATQENPSFADAWYNEGTALCKLDRYEDAVKAFDTVLEINPSYANARKNRDLAQQAIKQTP